MATGMQINSIAILAPMDERGSYRFDQEILGRNGRAAAVPAPYATVTWDFDYLTKDEYAWWYSTLLSGQPSQEYTQCKFFNAVGTLTTYSHCVVLRPTYERFQDGLLWGVRVVIDWIY